MSVKIGKHEFKLRGLTRREIKALRKEGFPLESLGQVEDYEKRDEGLDKIFSLAVASGDPDDLTQGEGLKLWAEVVRETYGGKESRKNSESPPPSSSGVSGMTAESAEKPASDPNATVQKSDANNG